MVYRSDGFLGLKEELDQARLPCRYSLINRSKRKQRAARTTPKPRAVTNISVLFSGVPRLPRYPLELARIHLLVVVLLAQPAIATCSSTWVDSQPVSDVPEQASWDRSSSRESDDGFYQGSRDPRLATVYALPTRPDSDVVPGPKRFFRSIVSQTFPSHFPPGQREQARKFFLLWGRA